MTLGKVLPDVPCFPSDGSPMPRTKYSRPNSFLAELIPGGPGWVDVRGRFIDRTRDGENKVYLFEVELRGETLKATVSAGDPSNSNSFSDRLGSGRPVTVLKGLSTGHRPDLKAKALLIGKYMIESYTAEQDFLRKKFNASSVIVQTRAIRAGLPEEIRLADGWQITKREFKNADSIFSATVAQQDRP